MKANGLRGLVAGVAVAALSASVVHASVEVEGVTFSQRYTDGRVELELGCVGVLRYMRFIKGYVAALYLDDEDAAAKVLSDVPKRLEISYFWEIEGEKIASAGEELVARNVAPDELAELRPQLSAIRALYDDVRPGDRYALTYVPGTGTELSLNGKVKGLIPGAEFARAYFAIWLGEEPIDASLKEQLLSCR